MTTLTIHKPVMPDEVTGFLCLKKGHSVLDGTVGCGGHASIILDKIGSSGLLIGIDQDEKALDIARQRLSEFKKCYKLVCSNFSNLDKVLLGFGIKYVNAALFDLGVSSLQLEDAARGFSFTKEGLLDMRMDLSSDVRAYDIVNRCKREELERIIRDFGQERYFRKVASFIVKRRERHPITSTLELSRLIEEAIGGKYRTQKIHPATRVFQGIRIAVNSELENIDLALSKLKDFLAPGARLCVISFHSLEDRIVKNKFKAFKSENLGTIITKKPVRAGSDEVRENPRSRSSKLRVFEKAG